MFNYYTHKRMYCLPAFNTYPKLWINNVTEALMLKVKGEARSTADLSWSFY